MSSNRPVTENDFRKDEFKDKDPADYEFRHDGKIVRKDRWETGIKTISAILNFRDYEIQDLVERVRELAGLDNGWESISTINELADEPECNNLTLKMRDGSILKNVTLKFDPTDSSGKVKEARFSWNKVIIHEKDIEALK